MLETEPRRKERPTLSPEGKPIIRVMDFGNSYYLRSDLFPNIITKLTSYPKNQDLEEFSDFLIDRAQRNFDWLKKGDHAEGKENLIDNLSTLLVAHKKHSNGSLAIGFEFMTEIGNPRELTRPYSYPIELRREGEVVEIDKKITLAFDHKWLGWGSFVIIGNKSNKILMDRQIDKGLFPWKSAGEFSMMQAHLSRRRPRLFIGPDYEVVMGFASENKLLLNVNSVDLATLKNLEFHPDYNHYIDLLRSYTTGSPLVIPST